MQTLLLESSGPFTGDMLIGLLCDLGVKPSTFEWELSQVDLGDFHMHFDRQRRGDAEGTRFGIHAGVVHTHDQDADEGPTPEAHVHAGEAHGQGHEHRGHEDHDHEHHGHDHEAHGDDCHTAADLRQRLEAGELADAVKHRVLNVFDQFCAREAGRLNADPRTLAFEEEGALIIGARIVCACAGLAGLGVEHLGGSATADEPLAAAILEVYRTADSTLLSSEAKSGWGTGAGGSLHGTLG